MKVTHPVLRFYGGKWKIAPWIISHFPEHSTYVEPFCGGLSVLLQKRPSKAEVANDLDGNVVNFFKVLREKPDALRRAIELTPFSRQECYLSCKPAKEPLEAARRFYIRAWQTQHGAPHMGQNGWRFTKQIGDGKRHYSVNDWNNVTKLDPAIQRIKHVQFEYDDALSIIPRFDSSTTLFYVDPPYVASTRADRWKRNGYTHEMDDEQHRLLAEILHLVKGMVIVSGYPSPLYEKLYKGWRKVSIEVILAKRGEGRPSERTECIWISSKASTQHRQLELKGMGVREA